MKERQGSSRKTSALRENARFPSGRSPGGISEPQDIQGGDESQSGLLFPGLYVTATPIGNARDITLRALDVLKGCDAILAEDTRVTAKLLALFGISRPVFAYNDHNAARERPRVLARLAKGERIALVSDAGTPLVSDPGYKLVREAIAQGHHVHAVPGASALLAGLVLSGLPSDRFLFAGFLSAKHGERETALSDLREVRASLVFFESPQRLAESLAQMAEIFGPREAAIMREMTKKFEEVRRGDLVSLAGHYREADTPKGEVTIVVAPPLRAEPDWKKIDRLLEAALAFMPVRAAADLVAEALDLPRRGIYDRALQSRKAHVRDA